MELHSSVKAKQLWNFMSVAVFMMRKGLLSKRKRISMEMSLIMKRGMLLGKNLGSLIALHHHSKSKQATPISPIFYGFQEHDFSCENSPNPILFQLTTKRRRSYFPCISASTTDADEEPEQSPNSPVALPQRAYSAGTPAPRARQVLKSPLSVRVSNYSNDEGIHGGQSEEVDNQAAEFIKRFYEQLQAQSPLTNLRASECQ